MRTFWWAAVSGCTNRVLQDCGYAPYKGQNMLQIPSLILFIQSRAHRPAIDCPLSRELVVGTPSEQEYTNASNVLDTISILYAKKLLTSGSMRTNFVSVREWALSSEGPRERWLLCVRESNLMCARIYFLCTLNSIDTVNVERQFLWVYLGSSSRVRSYRHTDCSVFVSWRKLQVT